MGLNAAQAFNKALTLFSSLYQDMSASDLPEGLSPDNQDIWFLPGLGKTRPALTRELVTPQGTATMMSLADFQAPDGNWYSIYMDEFGTIRAQNPVTGITGVFPILGLTDGVQFKAESAFDKVFFASYSQALAQAFSVNPFVGVDVPCYWNGGRNNRVTADPPGAPVAVVDNNISYAIQSASTGLNMIAAINITSISQVGNLVTVIFAPGSTLPLPLVGDSVLIASVTPSTYNGTFPIASAAYGPTFTQMTITFLMTTTGLPPGGGGTISLSMAIVRTTTATAIVAGNRVTIAGAGVTGFNGTWPVLLVRLATNIFVSLGSTFSLSDSGSGTLSLAGSIAAGVHSAVVMFKSTDGAITGPSIPFTWVAEGGLPALVSNIPIGPPQTAQRIVAFTPSGGQNYYYLTPSVVPATGTTAAIVSQGTIVNDNVSTSAIMDFSDQALTAGTQIDIPGNNLFNQVVLGPCLSVIEYQGRLAWLGEINNVKNFYPGLGFEGGYLPKISIPAQPLGWSQFGSTGGSVSLENSFLSDISGVWLQMTSAGGANDCMLSQSAYQDFYGAPILQSNIPYTFRLRIFNDGATAGNFVAELFSATAGVLGSATIPFSAMGNGHFEWVALPFVDGFSAVPADAQFRIYLQGITNGAIIGIDDMMVIDTAQPVLAQQVRISYFANEFGYDEETGLIGFDTQDSLVGAFKQRGYLYPISDRSLFLTQDNGTTEPNDWNTSQVATDCGLSSPNCVATEKSLAYWVGQHGFQIFTGETPEKISQEIQPTMDAINWDAQLSMWLMNDSIERAVYFGIPFGAEILAPTKVVYMTYRSLRSAYNVPDPMHVSYSGKLIGTELCRKFSLWNMTMNCGAILHRQTTQGLRPIANFGGGNGLPPTDPTPGTGEFYSLTFNKQTDDDYGQIFSYYVTYFFFVHDVEESLPVLGSHRHLYSYLSAFISGVGLVQITPYMDSLTNPWAGVPLPEYNLSTNPTRDLGWGLNVTCERMALKIAAVPIPVANITEIVILNNVATVYAPNGFAAGMNVTFAGLSNFPILNGTTHAVTAASPSQFSFAFTFADETGTDSGTATLVTAGSPLTDAAFSLQHLILAGRLENVFPLASVL